MRLDLNFSLFEFGGLSVIFPMFILSQISPLENHYFDIDELSLSQILWIQYTARLLFEYLRLVLLGESAIDLLEAPAMTSSPNAVYVIRALSSFASNIRHKARPGNLQMV